MHIFCAESIHQNQVGKPLGAEDAPWDLLIEKLETRELGEGRFSPMELSDLGHKEQWEACLNKNRYDFEKAEFILGGKDLLEKEIQDHANQEATVELTAVEGTFGNKELGEIVIPERVTGSFLDRLELLKDRKQRYQALWNKFMEGLRAQLSP